MNLIKALFVYGLVVEVFILKFIVHIKKHKFYLVVMFFSAMLVLMFNINLSFIMRVNLTLLKPSKYQKKYSM